MLKYGKIRHTEITVSASPKQFTTRGSKMANQILTQAILKEHLHYCSETGVFTWIKNKKTTKRNGIEAGCIDISTGYRKIGVLGKQYYAHRLVFMYVIGRFPINQTDHINHDRKDNRLENLREATKQENMMNAPIRKNNSSGVTGVWLRPNSKYTAEIMISGKKITLGTFGCITAASVARKSADIKYGFHENHGQQLRMEPIT